MTYLPKSPKSCPSATALYSLLTARWHCITPKKAPQLQDHLSHILLTFLREKTDSLPHRFLGIIPCHHQIVSTLVPQRQQRREGTDWSLVHISVACEQLPPALCVWHNTILSDTNDNLLPCLEWQIASLMKLFVLTTWQTSVFSRRW